MCSHLTKQAGQVWAHQVRKPEPEEGLRPCSWERVASTCSARSVVSKPSSFHLGHLASQHHGYYKQESREHGAGGCSGVQWSFEPICLWAMDPYHSLGFWHSLYPKPCPRVQRSTPHGHLIRNLINCAPGILPQRLLHPSRMLTHNTHNLILQLRLIWPPRNPRRNCRLTEGWGCVGRGRKDSRSLAPLPIAPRFTWSFKSKSLAGLPNPISTSHPDI